jgi:hypothetical protein
VAAPLNIGQQAGFDQHLKAIAYAQNRLAGRYKLVQFLPVAFPQLQGQHNTGTHCIALRKTARNYQALERIERAAVFCKLADVYYFGGAAG